MESCNSRKSGGEALTLSESPEEEVIVITIGEVPDSLAHIFGGSSRVWVGARERSRRLDLLLFDLGVMFWWTEGTPWGLTAVLRDQLA